MKMFSPTSSEKKPNADRNWEALQHLTAVFFENTSNDLFKLRGNLRGGDIMCFSGKLLLDDLLV
jgi:hypothetical protein|tara:strand:+ start:1396 stop:1587 length:192 start_codon:yes stop_codon:yes gene_type:complete